MNLRYLLSSICAGFLIISACSTSKQSTRHQTGQAITVEEDTLEEIVLNFQKEKTYRASYPIQFNLLHTQLDLQIDWEKQRLPGKATLWLKPHFYPASTLVLDAKGMDIKEVSLVAKDKSKLPLTFTYDSLKLNIALDKTYTAKDTFKIFIDYVSKPNERVTGGSSAITSDKGLFFINPLGKETAKPTQLWSQGETESNSCWFPTIEATNQRCTSEISITCEKKYLTLSNGLLTSSVDLGNGFRKDTWTMDMPHAPYLFMLTVGEFAVVKDKWRNIDVDYYVEPQYAAYAKAIFGNTPEMLDFFSDLLGYDFPWQKYAQVIVRDYVSGAMENTTATLFGEFVQRTKRELLDADYEDIIAHELFHHWFGDLVTCESWSNIPLNESFANYSEYLWKEHKYGKMEADRMLQKDLQNYLNESHSKNVDLIRFYYDDKEDVFDRHSYEKGGRVLHMLRNIVGDEAFFKSLNLYLKTNAFKAVEIHHLRLAFEEVTGQDLNWFFNQWFLNNGHPQLDFNYQYDRDTTFVIVKQQHNTKDDFVYELPFKIGLWFGDSCVTYPVTLCHALDSFKFYSKAIPDLIDGDADRVLLCTKKENKRLEDYIFQYQHHPQYLAKYEALEKLKPAQKGSRRALATTISALSDTFYIIRKFAIESIRLDGDSSPVWMEQIKQMALNDNHANVRSEAVKKLSLLKNKNLLDTFVKCTSDSSYETVAVALRAINDIDSNQAMQLASLFENEDNYEITNALCSMYASKQDGRFNDFFIKKFQTVTGYGKYPLMYHYANYLLNTNKKNTLSGIELLKDQTLNTDTKLIVSAGKGAIKRIISRYKILKDSIEEAQQEKDKELLAEYENIISFANKALETINKK